MKKIIKENIPQIIIFFLITFFLSINVYYSLSPKNEKVILNIHPWKFFPKKEHWVKINNIELSCFRTNISIGNPKNPFGLTYNIEVKTRYAIQNKNSAEKQIEKFSLISYENHQQVLSASFLPKNTDRFALENYLLFHEGIIGKDFFQRDENSPHVYNDAAAIQFYTSFFPPKRVTFEDTKGNTLFLDMNPLLLFKSHIFETVFFAIVVLASLLLGLFGYFENFFLPCYPWHMLSFIRL